MTKSTDALPSMFNGLRVIESVYLTEPGDPITVRRTWRERLFSRPWRPLRATKIIVPQVPSKKAIQLDRNTIVMHPAMVKQLRELKS